MKKMKKNIFNFLYRSFIFSNYQVSYIWILNNISSKGATCIKENNVYCLHITFNGICHNIQDLLNRIALSIKFSWGK